MGPVFSSVIGLPMNPIFPESSTLIDLNENLGNILHIVIGLRRGRAKPVAVMEMGHPSSIGKGSEPQAYILSVLEQSRLCKKANEGRFGDSGAAKRASRDQ